MILARTGEVPGGPTEIPLPVRAVEDPQWPASFRIEAPSDLGAFESIVLDVEGKKDIAPGQQLMISADGGQYYAEVVAIEKGNVRARKTWSNSRGYFRVDDMVPLVARKVARSAALCVSRSFPFREIVDPIPGEATAMDVNPRVWQMLVNIHTMLGMILERLDMETEGFLQAEKTRVNMSANGMAIKLRGRSDDNVNGVAERVEVENELRATIQSLSTLNNAQSFVAGGVTVIVDSQTVYANVSGFAGLVQGQRVEVHGLRDASGNLRAARVEAVGAGDGVDELRGAVSGLNVAASRFTLNNGITVNYSSLSGVAAMLLVIVVVLVSVIYPARVAAEIAIPDEPVTVIVSKNGWVRSRQGHGIDPAAIAYKTGDFPWLVQESRTIWPLVVIDTHGRAYSVRVADLPGGRGDGVPITTLVDFQDGGKPVQALTDAPEAQYLFANSGGYGFIAKVADLVTRQKAGKAFMSLEQGERVLHPAKVTGNTIAAVSENGRLLLFAVEEMKTQSAGRGVIVMDLDDKEALVGVLVNDGLRVVVEGIGRGGKTLPCKVQGKDMEKYRLHRARKGCLLPVKMKPAFIL